MRWVCCIFLWGFSFWCDVFSAFSRCPMHMPQAFPVQLPAVANIGRDSYHHLWRLGWGRLKMPVTNYKRNLMKQSDNLHHALVV